MKVIHLIKSLNRGGAETLLCEGLRVADRDRFEFEYAYFIDRFNDLALQLRELGAPVHSFGASGEREMLLSVRRVAQYLRETRADIVHAHLPLAGVLARLAGKLAGVPVVYTEHNPPDTYHPLTRLASKVTWGLQKEAIAISPDVAAAMLRHGGRRVPVCTIPNGIDTERFRRSASTAEARLRLGLPADIPVVGTVGMFRPQKRYDLWLDAARHLLTRIPTAQFILVGSGPTYAASVEQARRLGLHDRVRFVGTADDVRPYLEALDVFMMSSEYEGFGLAPVEALALQVPVVATAVAGIRSVLGPDSGAVLVPFGPDSAEALSRETMRLLVNPRAREQAGALGRAVAVERYGLVRMQRELEAVYQRVATQ